MKASSITVNVTAQNIAKGTPGDPYYCPIALALRAKGYKDAVVGSDGINVTTRSGRQREYTVPARAVKFIKSFDRRSTSRTYSNGRKAPALKPFSFVAKLEAA